MGGSGSESGSECERDPHIHMYVLYAVGQRICLCNMLFACVSHCVAPVEVVESLLPEKFFKHK